MTEVALARAGSGVLVTRFGGLFPALATTLDSGFVLRRLFGAGLEVRVAMWVAAIEEDHVVAVNLYGGGEDCQVIEMQVGGHGRGECCSFHRMKRRFPPDGSAVSNHTRDHRRRTHAESQG